MSVKKSIDDELDKLTSISQRGGGIGEPGLEQEIGRRIDFHKHRQAHDLYRKGQSHSLTKRRLNSHKYCHPYLSTLTITWTLLKRVPWLFLNLVSVLIPATNF